MWIVERRCNMEFKSQKHLMKSESSSIVNWTLLKLGPLHCYQLIRSYHRYGYISVEVTHRKENTYPFHYITIFQFIKKKISLYTVYNYCAFFYISAIYTGKTTLCADNNLWSWSIKVTFVSCCEMTSDSCVCLKTILCAFPRKVAGKFCKKRTKMY